MRKNINKFKSSLPIEFNYNLPIIEFTGNRRATIEGSTGVLHYSGDMIRINTRRFVAAFSGRGLTLKCISPTCVIIEGFITNTEFIS